MVVPKPRPRWIVVALLAMVVVVGLSTELIARRPRTTHGPAAAADPDVRVAFLYDETPGTGDGERVLPALHGAGLAIDAARLAGELPVEVELVPIAWRTDEAAVRTLLDDPGFVAAIGAPYLSGQLRLGERLDAAGVPFATLSTLGPELSHNGWVAWLRAVPDVGSEAHAIAGWLSAQGFSAEEVCLAGDGSPGSPLLLNAVLGELGGRPAARVRLGSEADVPSAAARLVQARCGALVWGGLGAPGGALAGAIRSAGATPLAIVGGSGLREPAFAEASGRAGNGAVSACACVDLSTETSLAAQRFVQDYQSRFGRPPGPFAVEAWDVARMLLREVGDGALTREGLAEVLGERGPFAGLAGTYRFRPDGELDEDPTRVTLARLRTGRWVPLE